MWHKTSSPPMDSSVDNETLLIVRCVGLNVPAKTAFKNVGMLSNIFLMATGAKTATNEKRTIRMSHSAPFRLGGRPPNTEPTQFYISETIEDVSDISPSIVASVRCPADLDCTIRLSVYYSSNLTGEKDVLLAGTSFNRREVLRGVQSKGVFISEMVSEYCPGSKAFVEVVGHFPNVLPDVATVYPSADPAAVLAAQQEHLGFEITSRRYSGNPFKQRYVFYGEQDPYIPLVVAEESTWEPRYSALIPALFMENFTAALMRSINAWNMRYELERKRQGRFRSLKEAIQHGWHFINVTVLEARIGGSKVQKERLRQQQLLQEQALAAAAAAAAGEGQGQGQPAGSAASNSRTSSRFPSSAGTRALSVSPSGAPNGGQAGAPPPVYNVCIPISPPSWVDGSDGADSDTGPKVEVAEGYVRGGKKVLHDESAPCTHVDISVHDKSQVFAMPLGRTNTEHFTMNPVYGANLYQPVHGKRGSLVPVAGSDCVEICYAERSCQFYSYDTTDRDSVTRWHHLQRQLSRQSGVTNAQPASDGLAATASAEESGASYNSSSSGSSSSHSHSQSNSHSAGRSGPDAARQRHLSAALQSVLPLPPADCVVTCAAREAHFCRFISSCSGSAVVFDVFMDDLATGQRKRVGTCSLRLSPNCKVDAWLPVTPEPGPDGELLRDVEVRVWVSVKSPFDDERDRSTSGDRSRTQSLSVSTDAPGTVAASVGVGSNGASGEGDCTLSRGRDYFNTKPSPSAMPEVYTFQRSIQGVAAKTSEGGDRSRTASSDVTASPGAGGAEGRGSSAFWLAQAQADEKVQELADYRATIANAYEWTWFAGFNGLDPLLADDHLNFSGASAVNGDAGRAHSSELHGDKLRTESTASVSTGNLARTSVTGAAASAASPARASFSAAAARVEALQPAAAATAAEEEEPVEDFEEHFESHRMSVFECAPPTASVTLPGDESFPLSAAEVAQHVTGAAESNPSSLFDGAVADGVPVGDVVSSELTTGAPTPTPQLDGDQGQGDSPHSCGLAEDHASKRASRRTRRRAESGTRGRVDFAYPLEWIRAHVEAMQQLAMELGSLVPMLKKAHKDDRGFRASPFKKQAEWQALPVNLHYQLMAVKPHVADSTVPVRTDIVHSVTCGAMTPHMLGHKQGGLYFQESKLVAAKMELERAKQAYNLRVAMAGSTCISTAHTEPYGVYKRLCDIGDKTLKFETMCLQICHRRAYAVSQALSIAVNALLLKIGLALQGAVPDRVAEQWLTCGILLVFEGLLSVVAHERSMLEDTISAVDALRSFQVRLLPYPDEPEVAAEAVRTPPAEAQPFGTADLLDLGSVEEALLGDAADQPTPETPIESGPTTPPAEGPRKLKLELKGREVTVYVPATSIRKLPDSYRAAMYHGGGAVIPFVSVLFTQGIDIQQTMVTTFGGDTAKGRVNNLHLQHDVNLKGLRDINAYCLKVSPMSPGPCAPDGSPSSGSNSAPGPAARSTSAAPSDSTEAISPAKKAQVNSQLLTHPMVKPLQDTILSSSLTLKNVDLLIEVERLALMLGGCRVTFCKSGKDRTGMACTLEQSRQLGERFGCGMAAARVLRDANLMRLYGTRLLIAEKNIGRKVYSINRMQAQFLPVMFRPPNAVCEDLMKKDNS